MILIKPDYEFGVTIGIQGLGSVISEMELNGKKLVVRLLKSKYITGYIRMKIK